ncbi:hypothetical protein ACIQVK_44235 [Streptomyces sp. NPDC090493]|uniref:hypothetical protein n=1 Tax=Streptomyces sp. NPDC090493 TaxID=3365964 RepID=UPI003810507C
MRRLRRPRPVALLVAGLATAALGVVACYTNTYDGQNAGATVGSSTCFVGVEWRGEPGVFTSCDGTDPDAKPRPTGTPDTVTAYNDGFIDGRADAMGDDNRDGRVDEDESGWDCRTMGNRVCGGDVPPECQDAGEAVQLCVTVASRPAYGWTNPSGSRVENPDGHAQVRDLEEKPGTPDFTAALRALDEEYREHSPRA